MKYVIVARNREQARLWIERTRATNKEWNDTYPNSNDILIVNNPELLRGFNVDRGILLDGWRSIPNIKEIVEALLIHSFDTGAATNPVLKLIYAELTT